MTRSVDPIAKHRREVWLHIVLPVVLTAGLLSLPLVVLFTLAVAGVLDADQVTTISSMMLTICILLPLIIVIVGINLLVVSMAWGSGKLPQLIAPPLRAGRQRLVALADWLPKQSARAMHPIIAIDTRLTRWERFSAALMGLRKTTTDQQLEHTPDEH